MSVARVMRCDFNVTTNGNRPSRPVKSASDPSVTSDGVSEKDGKLVRLDTLAAVNLYSEKAVKMSSRHDKSQSRHTISDFDTSLADD